MKPTPSSYVRCGVIALGAVILQLSGLGPLRFFGGTPDLMPLVVAAVAIYAGSVTGAAMGFGTGLLLDLAVGSTLGMSSLVLTAVGYGVGRYREVRDPAHGLMAIPIGAVASLGWVLAFGAVAFMLDVGATVSAHVFSDMVVTVLLNTIIAIPVFWVVRRILGSALAVDPLHARRKRKAPLDSGPIGLRGMEI